MKMSMQFFSEVCRSVPSVHKQHLQVAFRIQEKWQPYSKKSKNYFKFVRTYEYTNNKHVENIFYLKMHYQYKYK